MDSAVAGWNNLDLELSWYQKLLRRWLDACSLEGFYSTSSQCRSHQGSIGWPVHQLVFWNTRTQQKLHLYNDFFGKLEDQPSGRPRGNLGEHSICQQGCAAVLSPCSCPFHLSLPVERRWCCAVLASLEGHSDNVVFNQSLNGTACRRSDVLAPICSTLSKFLPSLFSRAGNQKKEWKHLRHLD